MQLIKGMEKALLRLLLATDEVNIINHQQVNTSIFVAEIVCFSLTNGTDEVIGKLLTADVEHPHLACLSHMADGLQ